MGATALAMRRRMGEPGAPTAPQPQPMSPDDCARAIQELTVKYEKELSAARAAGNVTSDASPELKRSLDKATAELAATKAENAALKTENAELKAQLDAATAPASPADAPTSPDAGAKKGGRSGR